MMRLTESMQEKGWFLVTASFLLFICYPLPQYTPAYSRVLYASDGTLLSAVVSSDGQWCFPGEGAVPEEFAICLRLFEDEYMALHPGVNPISVIRSARINLQQKRIVRGASTLAMQVMRMKNRQEKRSLTRKLLEMAGAIKLSLLVSDEEIIRIWSSMAPFGGNTIGLKAASLRYFGREESQLSWAEYALLAVMPNNPSGANLSVNRHRLKANRDALLKKLADKGFLPVEDLPRYLREELPDRQWSVPRNAFHLLHHLTSQHPETYIFKSTVSSQIQQQTQEILRTEGAFLQKEDIKNMALVVLDVENDCLLAYHGNLPAIGTNFSYVDIVQAPRSYGSLLKPFLYLHALETGQFLPQQLVADVPTAFGDFSPDNFDKKFRGAVGLDEMVIQSLNVPAVRVLKQVGLQSFYSRIRSLDVDFLTKGADHYGLSLILGGGESSLWEMCRLYKGLSRNFAGKPTPFSDIQVLRDKKVLHPNEVVFSPWPLYHTLRTMADVRRPREERFWSLFGSERPVAWKTGTSYGHKDAWSVGFNGKYLVGVWVGNAGGEGRYDLTGISRAAPVMFQVFRALPEAGLPLKPPLVQGTKISVCKASGKRAGPLCTDRYLQPAQGHLLSLESCQWHQVCAVNEAGLRISPGCTVPVHHTDTLFVLPPQMEFYYRASHPEYSEIPPTDGQCALTEAGCNIIYPRQGMTIFLPKQITGKNNELFFEAYHRRDDALLYWYDNDQYLGTTHSGAHRLSAAPAPGHHVLTIIDQWGFREKVTFQVVE